MIDSEIKQSGSEEQTRPYIEYSFNKIGFFDRNKNFLYEKTADSEDGAIMYEPQDALSIIPHSTATQRQDIINNPNIPDIVGVFPEVNLEETLTNNDEFEQVVIGKTLYADKNENIVKNPPCSCVMKYYGINKKCIALQYFIIHK